MYIKSKAAPMYIRFERSFMCSAPKADLKKHKVISLKRVEIMKNTFDAANFSLIERDTMVTIIEKV